MHRIIFDCWYGAEVESRLPAEARGASCCCPTSRAAEALTRGLRTIAPWRRSVLVTISGAAAANLYLLVAAVSRRRRLVLLEFMEQGVGPHSPRRVVYRVRRALLKLARVHLQVATTEERLGLLRGGFAPERVHLLKWPDKLDAAPAASGAAKIPRRVLASGRRTDWETVFAAAQGQSWDLVAVCAAHDLAEVQRLAAERFPAAEVLSEISLDEHRDHVARAEVYCIALPGHEKGSIGQVRLMDAATAGTAVVITRLPAVTEYTDATAVALVEPHDPVQLRAEINALLDDAPRRAGLATALTDRAERTMDDHLRDITAIVAAVDAESGRG